jgi:hypothetical protein
MVKNSNLRDNAIVALKSARIELVLQECHYLVWGYNRTTRPRLDKFV